MPSVRILILIVIKVIIYVVIVVGMTSVSAELAHACIAAETIASPSIVVLMMVQMHEHAVHIGIVGVKIIIAMLLLVGIEPRLRVPA